MGGQERLLRWLSRWCFSSGCKDYVTLVALEEEKVEELVFVLLLLLLVDDLKQKTDKAWFEAHHGHQFAKKERWRIWTIFIEGISVGWLAGSFCWKNRRQYAFRGWQQQQHAPTEDYSLLHQKAGLGNLLPGLSGWGQSKPLCGSSGLPDSIIFVDQEIQPSQAHQAGEVPQRVFKVSGDAVIMLKVFVSSCIASATKLNTTHDSTQ